MNKTLVADVAEVYAANMTTSLERAVGEIAQLVGVEVSSCGQHVPPDAALVLAEPGPAEGLRLGLEGKVPLVTVSDTSAEADLHLPAQAPELAQILLAGTTAVIDRDRLRTVFVAGWQGGAGTSSIASGLAGGCGALLLDASGNPPYQEVTDRALHWGRIDPHDPPVRGDLFATATRGARKQGVLSKLPDVAMVEDPRVRNLLGVIEGEAVVDAGVWRPELEKVMLHVAAGGRPVRLVLIGRTDPNDCLRLVNILTVASALWLPTWLMSAGKPGEQMALIGEHWRIPLVRRPRARGNAKVWRRMWEELWRATK